MTDTSVQVASLQSDLTNLRNLLHASTAREAALEVELASVRAQLGGGTPGATQAVPKAAGAVSPMLSGGMLEAEAAEVIQEMGVAAGGRRSMVAKRDREGKRVGGVALMVRSLPGVSWIFPHRRVELTDLSLTPCLRPR